MDDRPLVPQLLARARRRYFANLVLEQCVLALAISMGGAILLLLAGTQILDWYWIVLLAVASLGTGLYRLRQTIPSTYLLAQRVDRRLSLADALSTATYFASPEARGDEAIRERQRREADEVARTISPELAVPLRRPKYVYHAVALAAVACGLFGLRYAATGTLNLKPSLVKIAFDTFFPQTQIAKATRPRDNRKPPLDQGDPDSPTVKNDQTPDQPLDANDAADQNNPQAADNSKDKADKGQQKQEQSPDQQGENADKGDKQQNGNDADQQNAQNSKDGKQAGKQDSKQGSSTENSSLMDKLKDAMSNMLNKMKSSQKDSDPQSAQNQKSQREKSSQTSKGQQQKQNASADAQSDQQQTNTGDPKDSADAKNGEKSSDKNASDDSKSGIGSADGDKSAKEAEQLQAMGKISEIFGKRSQNVTGQVMVEVGQSKQELKTPWAQKQAEHVEAGSEIHRDEVPLMYQQFVQQYFEEIRKGADSSRSSKNP